MHKQRLYVLIAAAAGMLGTFLPWVSLPFLGSVSGVNAGADGWISFVFFGVVVAMTLIGNRESLLEGYQFTLSVVFGAVGAIFGLWKIIDINSVMGGKGQGEMGKAMGKMISVGFGLYLIVLAGIAVVVLALMLKKGEQKTQQ